MPDDLKIEGDKRFFTAALDRADLVVHGRHSQEEQPNAPKRQRLILTGKVAALAPDPDNPKALLWNPAGCPFETASREAGVSSGMVAIIGGPGVFGMFMDRYDTFWLSQAHRLTLPGGMGGFLDVPSRSPQSVLADHGLKAVETRILDAERGVDVTAWRRQV